MITCVPEGRRDWVLTSLEVIPGSVERKKLDSSPVMVATTSPSGYLLCMINPKFCQGAVTFIP